jgi:hypothetical protein
MTTMISTHNHPDMAASLAGAGAFRLTLPRRLVTCHLAGGGGERRNSRNSRALAGSRADRHERGFMVEHVMELLAAS